MRWLSALRQSQVGEQQKWRHSPKRDRPQEGGSGRDVRYACHEMKPKFGRSEFDCTNGLIACQAAARLPDDY